MNSGSIFMSTIVHVIHSQYSYIRIYILDQYINHVISACNIYHIYLSQCWWGKKKLWKKSIKVVPSSQYCNYEWFLLKKKKKSTWEKIKKKPPTICQYCLIYIFFLFLTGYRKKHLKYFFYQEKVLLYLLNKKLFFI